MQASIARFLTIKNVSLYRAMILFSVTSFSLNNSDKSFISYTLKKTILNTNDDINNLIYTVQCSFQFRMPATALCRHYCRKHEDKYLWRNLETTKEFENLNEISHCHVMSSLGELTIMFEFFSAVDSLFVHFICFAALKILQIFFGGY